MLLLAVTRMLSRRLRLCTRPFPYDCHERRWYLVQCNDGQEEGATARVVTARDK